MKRHLLISFLTLYWVLLTAQSEDWLWVNGAGGASSDRGRAIATDGFGNCYVTGNYLGTATFGGTTFTSSGSDDIFIAKLDTFGNWIWVKTAGSTGVDAGYGIATDAGGNCYVTGYFQGTATFGGTSLVSSGGSDIFIAKLDANGNWLWANRAGGIASDIAYAISTGAGGNCYITGSFSDTATFGDSSHTSSGANDIFVAGMDSSGNWLWLKAAGGTSTDIGYGISASADGSCYITGSFMSSASFGVSSLASIGSSDIFIAKLDANSNWLWAISAGGTGSDTGSGIATDLSGNCYITGSFSGTAGFGSSTLISGGGVDIVITKTDPDGNWLWAKKAGGTGSDTGYGIATDTIGNCYATGFFSSTAGFGSTTLTSSGANEIFNTKLDTNGNWLWANGAGGSSLDIGYAIASDSNGNCYVTGVFVGTATFGTLSINLSGGNNVFITKTGLPYPLITTNIPETVEFGNVYLDTSSPPFPVWIKNPGMADLVINTLSLQPTSSAFSIQPITLPFTIAARDSVSIDLLFTPQGLGNATDILMISNNSQNQALYALQLSGTGIYAEPMPPANVTTHINGYDYIITWDDVTQTVANTPITPDFYFIYFNGSPDPLGLFYFLGRSFNTQFTHYDVALGAEHMFYRVTAIKLTGRNVDMDWIDAQIRSGMTEEEVSAILKTLERPQPSAVK